MIQVDPFRERVQTLLARVAYKDSPAKFRLIQKAPGVLLLQHHQIVAEVGHGTMEIRRWVDQGGRKFYLSPHMTDGEILQTALMAILAFEEHEAREAFLFDGARIFSPHKSLAALQATEEDKRGHVQQA